MDIPGITILDPKGGLVGSEAVRGGEAANRILELMKKAVKGKP